MNFSVLSQLEFADTKMRGIFSSHCIGIRALYSEYFTYFYVQYERNLLIILEYFQNDRIQ